MIEPYSKDVLWILILGFIIAFILAFSVGANDVGNSFGTSVGSTAITLTQALILASFAEIFGAVLIGYKVTDTLRRDLMYLDQFDNKEAELMIMSVCVLISVSTCLLLACYFGLPISGTQSTVSAYIGSTFDKGARGLRWRVLGKIAVVWLITPILSGIVSALFIWIIEKMILKAKDTLEAGLTFLPFFYFFTIFVNIFSITYEGSELLGMQNFGWSMATIIATSVAVVSSILCRIFLVPWQRRKIENLIASPNQQRNSILSLFSVETSVHVAASHLFIYLQVLAAVFSSFAHGGNDVSHSTGPMVALWSIYTRGTVNQDGSCPVYLLFAAGCSIALGLCCLGYRVIYTLGSDLSKITPYSGFAIEIGAATIVLGGSTLGLPVSTTQCKVGSIVFVGLFSSMENVQWSTLREIVVAWVTTFPIASLVSYGSTVSLTAIYRRVSS